MKTKTAEITLIEIGQFKGRHPVEFLLIEKGFKAKKSFSLPPVLLGKLTTWHDRVTGTYHYTQTLSE